MDAIAVLLLRRDPATLLWVMAAYVLPLLAYCVTAALAFLALARRGGAPGRVIAQGLLVLVVPIVGSVLVLLGSDRLSSTRG